MRFFPKRLSFYVYFDWIKKKIEVRRLLTSENGQTRCFSSKPSEGVRNTFSLNRGLETSRSFPTDKSSAIGEGLEKYSELLLICLRKTFNLKRRSQL